MVEHIRERVLTLWIACKSSEMGAENDMGSDIIGFDFLNNYPHLDLGYNSSKRRILEKFPAGEITMGTLKDSWQPREFGCIKEKDYPLKSSCQDTACYYHPDNNNNLNVESKCDFNKGALWHINQTISLTGTRKITSAKFSKNYVDIMLQQVLNHNPLQIDNLLLYLAGSNDVTPNELNRILNLINLTATEISSLFIDDEMLINDTTEEINLDDYATLSLDRLREKAIADSASVRVPIKRTVNHRKRSRNIRTYAIKRSEGICEACGSDAPFTQKNGYPFLEVHHVTMLCNGGADDIYSVLAICPNCHKRAHHSIDKDDFQEQLKKKIALIEPR